MHAWRRGLTILCCMPFLPPIASIITLFYFPAWLPDYVDARRVRNAYARRYSSTVSQWCRNFVSLWPVLPSTIVWCICFRVCDVFPSRWYISVLISKKNMATYWLRTVLKKTCWRESTQLLYVHTFFVGSELPLNQCFSPCNASPSPRGVSNLEEKKIVSSINFARENQKRILVCIDEKMVLARLR